MAREPKTMLLEEASNVHTLLDEACRQPVLLERDGVRFRVERDPNDFGDSYDPEAVVRALNETYGSWADLDIEQMIADTRRWREEGSRPFDQS